MQMSEFHEVNDHLLLIYKVENISSNFIRAGYKLRNSDSDRISVFHQIHNMIIKLCKS